MIDADPVEGRPNPWLDDQPGRQLDLGAAPMSRTPRGGAHHIFRQPAGRTWRCSEGRLAPGIDVRAEGATPSCRRRSAGAAFGTEQTPSGGARRMKLSALQGRKRRRT